MNDPYHFREYFDVADELWEWESAGQPPQSDDPLAPITPDDIDTRCMEWAKIASDEYGLPWPPFLPNAEELAMDFQNGRYRGKNNPYRVDNAQAQTQPKEST